MRKKRMRKKEEVRENEIERENRETGGGVGEGGDMVERFPTATHLYHCLVTFTGI